MSSEASASGNAFVINFTLTCRCSRRGLSTSTDIDIIAFHPSYVYVPLPGEKPTEAAEPLRSSKRGRPPKRNGSGGKQKASTVPLLRESILSPLEHSGVIAATLSEGPRKWQGIVRIPGNGDDNVRRVIGVRSREGSFRRMNITCVAVSTFTL